MISGDRIYLHHLDYLDHHIDHQILRSTLCPYRYNAET